MHQLPNTHTHKTSIGKFTYRCTSFSTHKHQHMQTHQWRWWKKKRERYEKPVAGTAENQKNWQVLRADLKNCHARCKHLINTFTLLLSYWIIPSYNSCVPSTWLSEVTNYVVVREREAQRHRERDRQTDRQTERLRERERDSRETDRDLERLRERERERKRERRVLVLISVQHTTQQPPLGPTLDRLTIDVDSDRDGQSNLSGHVVVEQNHVSARLVDCRADLNLPLQQRQHPVC